MVHVKHAILPQSLESQIFKSRIPMVEAGSDSQVHYILNKIINAPCGTLKLLLALGVAKYIKSYKIHFVVQYATDYCPLEHDNYKTISAHLGSPISCYINNLHGAFIFLLSVHGDSSLRKSNLKTDSNRTWVPRAKSPQQGFPSLPCVPFRPSLTHLGLLKRGHSTTQHSYRVEA